ncbi:unnamed protein product [Moneuplotes crassus]|uniref:Dolichol-phosphate mannosyltransferase subunit 1 n=1 Tax=Euplotes crassus TaxID=5936 RepID=A0AAD1XTQ8_EUPCR|nr:unnamed protein product [Moneuplotes crassus]
MEASEFDRNIHGDKYSIILPTYQERDNLPIITWMILDMADRNNLDVEIIVVEDNSPDGTGLVADELQRIYGEKRIQVLKRAGKLGLGSAYMDGIKKCNGNFVILMDADFSHHPKFIPQFIEVQKRTDCDVVTGTRYRKGGGVYGWDLYRKLTSRVANFIASFLLNPKNASDLTGSFRLYKKHVLEDIMSQVKSRGYVFQMEVIVRAEKNGYSINEVPITFVDRVYGESKLGANEIISYLKGLLGLAKDL